MFLYYYEIPLFYVLAHLDIHNGIFKASKRMTLNLLKKGYYVKRVAGSECLLH